MRNFSDSYAGGGILVVLARRRDPQPSPYLASGAPQHCARCSAQFTAQNGGPACWHGADGDYYCSETCAAGTKSAA